MGSMVQVDNSRLSVVESDVKHLSSDVGEIKSELSDIRTINKNVAESLSRLTFIAEQNQKLELKINALEKFVWKVGGAVSLLAVLASIFGPAVGKIFGG